VEEDLEVIGQVSQAKFDVTRLSGVDIVLGYNWLKSLRVIIDFGRLAISREGLEIEGRAEGQGSVAPMQSIPTYVSQPPAKSKPKPMSMIPTSTIPTSSMITSQVQSSNLETIGSSQATNQPSQVEIQLRGTRSERKQVERGVAYRMFKKNGRISRPNNIPLGKPNRWNVGDAPLGTVDVDKTIKAKLCAVADHIQPGDDDYESLPSFVELELTPQEIEDIKNHVPSEYHDYLDVFHPRLGTGSLAPHRDYDMKIELKPDHDLRIAPLYELSPSQRIALKETIDRERAAGRIRPSTSSYGSPCFFVPKKDGRYRMVVDFRRLNASTIPDVYPLPLINQTYNDLAAAKWYTLIDLVSAYQQCRIAEGYEHLTAFRTQFGMFESLVVRDGLRNAPAVFQHFLNELFADLISEGIVIVYIDDIIIATTSLEELRRVTKVVFERLRKASLFIKASKCEFEQREVKFLGVKVSSEGIKADPGYVQGILDFPAPKNLRESRRFVGMASYYRRFIPNFAKIMRPLNMLTKKEVPFVWGGSSGNRISDHEESDE